MLAAVCPKCGSPTPVSLATPDTLSCVTCHYSGPAPAATRAYLYAAAEALGRADVRARRLNRAQRAAVLRGWASKLKFWIVLTFVTLPWVVGAAGCAAFGKGLQWWVVATLGFGPIVVMLVTGSIGTMLLDRSHRQVKQLCAAAPPAAPGEPARCHVCGGPLRVDPGEYIDECGYCHADNIVTPDVLGRVAERQNVVFDSYEHEVKVRAQALGSRGTYLTAGAVVAAAAAPLISFAIFLAVAAGLFFRGAEPYPVQYVAYRGKTGVCLGEISRAKDGSEFADFDTPPPWGFSRSMRLDAATSGDRFAPGQLLGRRVLSEYGVMRVDKIEGAALAEGDNMATGAPPGHASKLESVRGLCLADEKDSTRLVGHLSSAPTGLVVRGAELLIPNGGAISSISLRDGTQHRMPGSPDLVVMLATAGDHIYAVTTTALMHFDGSAWRQALPLNTRPAALAVDSDYAYVTGQSRETVETVPVVQVVPHASGTARTLDGLDARALLADEHVLWAASGKGLVSVAKDTWTMVVRVPLAEPPKLALLAQDRDDVYWVHDKLLERVPKAGGSPERLFEVDGVVAIAADEEAVFVARDVTQPYTSDAVGGVIRWSKRDRSLVNLAPRTRKVLSLALAPGQVYWIPDSDDVLASARR